MTPQIMSSDESTIDEDDHDEVILIHPLPWLSATVANFKQKLDDSIELNKTPQARRQRKKRVLGTDSMRPKPSDLPEWAVRQLV